MFVLFVYVFVFIKVLEFGCYGYYYVLFFMGFSFRDKIQWIFYKYMFS